MKGKIVNQNYYIIRSKAHLRCAIFTGSGFSEAPFMKAEEVVELFDSFWFGLHIFKKIPNSSTPPSNLDNQIQEESLEPDFSSIPTINTSSAMSDPLSSTPIFKFDSFSSNSVITSPSIDTILSDKDVTEASNPIGDHLKVWPKRKSINRVRKRRETKSLSELEFEELKGFMDLGFVFSVEDKDSTLASIIPGLQRLGKKEEEEEDCDESSIPRPYLSETWEVLESKKKENPLMNWKIPPVSNELSMKDNLKWWARTVASSVR